VEHAIRGLRRCDAAPRVAWRPSPNKTPPACPAIGAPLETGGPLPRSIRGLNSTGGSNKTDLNELMVPRTATSSVSAAVTGLI
jgi:hypothetical protein